MYEVILVKKEKRDELWERFKDDKLSIDELSYEMSGFNGEHVEQEIK